jgi:hypothetical protein
MRNKFPLQQARAVSQHSTMQYFTFHTSTQKLPATRSIGKDSSTFQHRRLAGVKFSVFSVCR